MKYTKMTVALFAAIMVLLAVPTDSCAAETIATSGAGNEGEALLDSDSNIADGVINEDYGQITWVIDNTGKLTVSGTGDVSDEYLHDRSPWYPYREEITSAEINVSGMTEAYALLSGCSALKEVDLSGFDTGSVTMYAYMFEDCSSLEEIDLSGLDTSSATYTGTMFLGCSALKRIDLSGFNTGNVVSMWKMFADCSSLEEIDLSGFDTSRVQSMCEMFAGCSSLTSLDLSNFDTGNVTDMSYMFNACTALTKLDLSGFDTGSVTTMEGMFSICIELTELNLSEFDTGNVTNMNNLFLGCNSLESLDLSSFDTGNVTTMEDMFGACNCLKQIETPINCACTADLPTDSEFLQWYLPDGTVTTALPQGLSESITILRKVTVTFTDIQDTAFYYDAVIWAVENDVTTGVTKTEFKPGRSCTRGEIVTFLYRAMNGEVSEGATCEFADVDENAFYYDAVLWAVENEITTGITPTSFAPGRYCTRGEIVTFLCRAMQGKASDNVSNSFTDVSSDAFYYDSMLWAVENGVTTGTTERTFAPGKACTRGECVTFLCRAVTEN